MVRWSIALVACTACGRLDFFGHEADAAIDVAGDAAVCPAGVEICDSFEGGLAAPWSPAGNVAVDTTLAHRGAASLHVHLDALQPGVGAGATITETTTLANPGPFWVRAWVRIASLPAQGNHLEILSAEQTMTPSLGDYVFFTSTAVELYSQFTDGIDAVQVAATTDTWLCLVWSVARAASATGTLDLTGDIAQPLHYAGATDGSPPIAEITLGLRFAPTNVTTVQPPLDLWIDDVITDHAAVTCAE